MGLLVPDDLWAVVEPLLPPDWLKPKSGRPRPLNRAAPAGILFVLRTGIQWHELPMELGLRCGLALNGSYHRLGPIALKKAYSGFS